VEEFPPLERLEAALAEADLACACSACLSSFFNSGRTEEGEREGSELMRTSGKDREGKGTYAVSRRLREEWLRPR